MKKYIRANDDDFYTHMIDEATPQVVSDLEAYTINYNESLEGYRMLKPAVDAFWADYEKFPNSNTMASLDIKYDLDKGRFYTKYLSLFNICKSLEKFPATGYGRFDYIKIKLCELARSILYNYPIGWKSYSRRKY